MVNIQRDQIVETFAELIDDDQIRTAMDLLMTSDAATQHRLVSGSSLETISQLFAALDEHDREEIVKRVAADVRQLLDRALLRIDRSDIVGIRRAHLEHANGRTDFAIAGGRLGAVSAADATITIFAAPSGAIQRDLPDALGIDEHSLQSALDPDEVSRFEMQGDALFMVWKRPHLADRDDVAVLDLVSLGFVLRDARLTIISGDTVPVLQSGLRVDSALDVMLHVMSVTVNEFMLELKRVKRTSRRIQGDLSNAIGNRQLLQMFTLSEGLVYHINAIDANGGVLKKMRTASMKIGLSQDQRDLLDDIAIDNAQCSEQGQVFSTVLAGMLDARGNLINNNMNVLLKNLTIVNVIFLPLGVIAGMGGMSEFSMVLDHYGVSWQAGYSAFTLGLCALGVMLWLVVRAFVNRRWGN